jgi:hypothetical protein
MPRGYRRQQSFLWPVNTDYLLSASKFLRFFRHLVLLQRDVLCICLSRSLAVKTSVKIHHRKLIYEKGIRTTPTELENLK